MRIVHLLILSLAALAAPDLRADEGPNANPLLESRVYLQVSPSGRQELMELFDTLEASVAAGETQEQPVVIVLHGQEAFPFLSRNYLANQMLVDRAAKLLAFGRIEMRMCETWMRSNGISPDELVPFVQTVPLAPEEVDRLERDGYLPYGELPERSSLL